MLKIILALFAALYASLAMAAVDVNTASATDLDTIKGIGPKMAASILDERKKNGNFKDWADFAARVKGVGEKNSAKFSESGLTVAGKTFSGAAPKAAAPAKAKPAAAATPASQPAGAKKTAAAAK
jgi:competence protein ComEA